MCVETNEKYNNNNEYIVLVCINQLNSNFPVFVFVFYDFICYCLMFEFVDNNNYMVGTRYVW